jgi:hypothetical protein
VPTAADDGRRRRECGLKQGSPGNVSGEQAPVMRHEQFHICLEFMTATGRRCTDVGTRTVIAIKLDRPVDPSWYDGPAYDLEACWLPGDDPESGTPPERTSGHR